MELSHYDPAHPSAFAATPGVHPVGRTVGPCEECPDPAMCQAEAECAIEARESLRGLL